MVCTIERVAQAKGKATDPVKYFVAPENQDLGVVKALRKPVPIAGFITFSSNPLDKGSNSLNLSRMPTARPDRKGEVRSCNTRHRPNS